MKNAINNQVGMVGDMFLWLVANVKQGVIYFIKQEGGNHKIACVYIAIKFKEKQMQVCNNEAGNNWNFSSILTCKD